MNPWKVNYLFLWKTAKVNKTKKAKESNSLSSKIEEYSNYINYKDLSCMYFELIFSVVK